MMRTRSRDEWIAHFAGTDVCLTIVHAQDEVRADPHLVARGVMPRAAGAAPVLGADTDALLDEAGIDAGRRGVLRAGGVI
jgi:crotonobetainyl-CoA:carnitine CoA-transferase CaiB-like acyl-CoA transferase